MCQYGSHLGRIGSASAAYKRGHPGGTIKMVIDFIQKPKNVHETLCRGSLFSFLNQLPSPFDIRDDESTATTFDVLDDSIPIVKGIY